MDFLPRRSLQKLEPVSKLLLFSLEMPGQGTKVNKTRCFQSSFVPSPGYQRVLKLALVSLVVLSLTGWGALGVEASEKKLNVLFIAVDDLRPELGCYGQQVIQTPHIDALAKRGTLFQRAYCQVAVCGASRASLMTGLRPTAERFLDYQTWAQDDAPEAVTLAEAFRQNGYHCLSNGKIFHHQTDTQDRSWSEPAWQPAQDGRKFFDPSSASMIQEKTLRGPVWEAPDVVDNAYVDGQVADKTIADLERMQQEGKPFFLACGFVKPHLPFYAPRKYWDLYDRATIPIADNQYRPQHAPKALISSYEIHSYHKRGIQYNSPAWHRGCRHGYYACVSYADAQVGRVIQSLDALGLADNTVIVLWGDHGWNVGEHNFWGKHNVMHLATRMPLLVVAPGTRPGQQSDRLVELVDLFPTLCELVGISTSDLELQGTSFTPLLEDPNLTWKEAAFSKYGVARSVITDRYNYAEYNNGEKMLYDLQRDPDENVNIAGAPEHEELVEQMSQLLKAGWQSVLP
jgi:arylsulfatase A-like enzyme